MASIPRVSSTASELNDFTESDGNFCHYIITITTNTISFPRLLSLLINTSTTTNTNTTTQTR